MRIQCHGQYLGRSRVMKTCEILTRGDSANEDSSFFMLPPGAIGSLNRVHHLRRRRRCYKKKVAIHFTIAKRAGPANTRQLSLPVGFVPSWNAAAPSHSAGVSCPQSRAGRKEKERQIWMPASRISYT